MAEWEWWKNLKKGAKAVSRKAFDYGSDVAYGAYVGYKEAKSRITGRDYNMRGEWNKFQQTKKEKGMRAGASTMATAAADVATDAAAGLEFGGKKAVSLVTGEDYNFTQEWHQFEDVKEQVGPSAFGTAALDEGQRMFIEKGHQAGNYVKQKFAPEMTWWLDFTADKTGLKREDIKEGVKILGEGALTLSSEVIFHPMDSAANLGNLMQTGVQKLTYSPQKEDTIPSQIQDPVIIGIYRLGGKQTPPGHAALWYRGETVDAFVGEGNVFNGVGVDTVFHPNQGEAGRNKPEWGKEGPFVFGSKDCDFYVVDAAQLGFRTPEEKQRFLNNIIRERQHPDWDLNSENCATRVNRVTEDVFLEAPRLHSPGLMNFDFPISIGAKLDRMCMTGSAYSITPEALGNYGQLLAMRNQERKEMLAKQQQENKGENVTATVNTAASEQSGLVARISQFSTAISEQIPESTGGFIQVLKNAMEYYQSPQGVPTPEKKDSKGTDLTAALRRKQEDRS